MMIFNVKTCSRTEHPWGSASGIGLAYKRQNTRFTKSFFKFSQAGPEIWTEHKGSQFRLLGRGRTRRFTKSPFPQAHTGTGKDRQNSSNPLDVSCYIHMTMAGHRCHWLLAQLAESARSVAARLSQIRRETEPASNLYPQIWSVERGR